MKKNTTATNTTAAELATFLFGQVNASFDAAHLITRLHEENGRDLAKAGAALEVEWSKLGGNIIPEKPVRLILEACLNTEWTAKEARTFVRGAGFVRPADEVAYDDDGMISKQRLSVLCNSIFLGVSNAKARGEGKEDKEDKEDKKVNTLLTVDEIVNAIEALASLPAADAAKIAKAVQAKLA